jgi:hypothetical protein
MDAVLSALFGSGALLAAISERMAQLLSGAAGAARGAPESKDGGEGRGEGEGGEGEGEGEGCGDAAKPEAEAAEAEAGAEADEPMR